MQGRHPNPCRHDEPCVDGTHFCEKPPCVREDDEVLWPCPLAGQPERCSPACRWDAVGRWEHRWDCPNEPGRSPSCGCMTCDAQRRDLLPMPERLMRPFIVCPTCGNKRCPKATHHDLACTGSNEPGQSGSAYETAPARTTTPPPASPA